MGRFDRLQLVRDGLAYRHPLYCRVCGRPLEIDTLVLCADGYERMYGEFVLSDEDEESHDYNWPDTHAACARKDPG